MADRDLKKLNRAELLEMLLFQTKEVERLRGEVERLQSLLDQRALVVDQAGSIAEAALQLSGIFEVAQAAADQYLENVASLSGRQEDICQRMLQETEERCRTLEEETEARCTKLLRKAEEEAQLVWIALEQRRKQAGGVG